MSQRTLPLDLHTQPNDQVVRVGKNHRALTVTDAPCELFVKVDANGIFPDKDVADAVNWLQHRVIVNSQFNHRDETVRGQTHRFTLLYSKLLEKTLGTRLYRK